MFSIKKATNKMFRFRLLTVSLALNSLLLITMVLKDISSRPKHRRNCRKLASNSSLEKLDLKSCEYQCQSHGSYSFSSGPAYLDRRLPEPNIKILMFGPKIRRLTGNCIIFTRNNNNSITTTTTPSSTDDDNKNDSSLTEVARLNCTPIIFDPVADKRLHHPENPRYAQYMRCDGQLNLVDHTQNHYVELRFNDFVPLRTKISTAGMMTERCTFPLAITAPAKSSNDLPRLDACIKIMHSYYNDWMQIFMFMEWWIHAGVNNVWAHRYTNTPDVEMVLQYYQNVIKTLHVLPSAWDLQAETNNFPYPVSLVQIQDCNLRLSNVADFVAHTDWDEHTAYRDHNLNTHNYLLNMLANDVAADPKISGWNFHRIYSADFEGFVEFVQSQSAQSSRISDSSQYGETVDVTAKDIKLYFQHLPTEIRVSGSIPPKLIVRPENILHQREHFVDEYLNGGKEKEVPFATMAMFHMRRKPRKGDSKPTNLIPSPFQSVTARIADRIVVHVAELQYQYRLRN